MLHTHKDDPSLFLDLPPWRHQIEAEAFCGQNIGRALFMEPRTGKTRTILMNATRCQPRTLVIFAPNGVHRNWITDELPRWWGPAVPWAAVIWRAAKADQVQFKRAMQALVNWPGTAVFAVNIDAATSPKMAAFLRALLARGPAMGVVDESADIAKDSAQRTKAILKLRDAFHWRRILDGTPTAESPLEAYTQCEFLQYRALGYSSFISFKYRYAVIQKAPIPGAPMGDCRQCNGNGCARCGFTGAAPARTHDVVTGYRNTEELKAKLARFAVVVKRADCADLPPKVISRRPFELNKEQREAYDDLRSEYRAELEDRTVTAAHILTRYIRLQQVAHGFWPAQEEGVLHDACDGAGCEHCLGGLVLVQRPLVRIGGSNPRLEALLAELRRLPGQCTIWTRFQQDSTDILKEVEGVRYDGQVSETDRAEAKRAYRAGDARYLVGSPQAGGRGLDFSHADAMVFYGHNFRLRLRQQAEDRGESLARKTSTSIVDLVAEDTIDEVVLKRLAAKADLSASMLDWREVLCGA